MSIWLILSAASLGFLAFFEPCTIATHTLYAARTARQPRPERRRALCILLASRTILLLGIFMAAMGLVRAFGIAWRVENAAPVLLLIAIIYLLSRKVYLPIPHLESFRLWPRHQNFSPSLRLGLSLPACTLPLVAIVAAGCAYSRQWETAFLAAIIFSLSFTLPTFVESTLGLQGRINRFLDQAARLTPYLTAGLMTSGALLLWFAQT